jgi:surfeit locus 1 family protein
MSSRSWLLSPRALLSHVLVLAAVVTMTQLGLWQLRRLDEVRSINDRIEQRMARAPAPLAELVPVSDDELDGLEFRPVTVHGTYHPEEEVLQRGRSWQGRSGYHVITPLRTDEGTVLVRRGWVPFEMDEPPVAEAAPPAGEVTVTGYLELSDRQPTGFGQRDPEVGVLPRVFHVDLERLDPQVTGDLLPVVVHLEGQEPVPSGDLPVAAPRPELSSSTHLSYAVQWFLFALVAVVAYGAWLRKRLQQLRSAPTDVTPPVQDRARGS